MPVCLLHQTFAGRAFYVRFQTGGAGISRQRSIPEGFRYTEDSSGLRRRSLSWTVRGTERQFPPLRAAGAE